MEERFVIEVGVRSFKYLGACYDRYDLKKSIMDAMFFMTKEDAQSHIDDVKLLQGKQCKIRKIKIEIVE